MRAATPLVLLAALAALLVAPLAGAQQEREPQRDYMVHMDLSQDPPRFIPDELTLLPGGTVQLMLFGKGGTHSLTLDSAPTFEAAVAAGTADGFYERSALFQGPQAPGTYAFHDKNSGARGTLIVRSVASQPPLIGVRENGYDLHFAPERLVVAPGATVTFRANGSFAHTLTSQTSGAWNDSALQLHPGQQATFTAPTTPGEYPFYCRYHKEGGMIGVLVVDGSPAPASSTAASPPPSSPTSGPAAKPTPALALPLLSLSVATALIIYSRMKR